MAELMDHVEALADQIGPRPVSTEEERQASLYIAEELTNLGLEVDVDEFATPTGVRWPYVVAFFCVIVGTVLSGLGMFLEQVSTPMFVLGLILTVAGTAIYYTERNGMAFLSKRRSGGVSQNVVAKYVPSSVARERSRRKIIIAAHVDTVRAEPEASPAVINRYPLIRKILYYDMLALPAVLFVRMLPLPWPEALDMALWVISLIGCLLALAAAAAIIANRFMPYISGGNDNASAAAVMLDVAKRLLDPAERERYSVEHHAEPEDLSAPVETFAPQLTGSFAPIRVHDAEQAKEAGVVPEGAELEYAPEAAGYDYATDEYVAHGYVQPSEGVGGYNVDEDLAWADHASRESGFEPAGSGYGSLTERSGHEEGAERVAHAAHTQLGDTMAYAGLGGQDGADPAHAQGGIQDDAWDSSIYDADPATGYGNASYRYGAATSGAYGEQQERQERPELQEHEGARLSEFDESAYNELFAPTAEQAQEHAEQESARAGHSFEAPGYEPAAAHGYDDMPAFYRRDDRYSSRAPEPAYVERVEHVEPVRPEREHLQARAAAQPADNVQVELQVQEPQTQEPETPRASSRRSEQDVPLGGYWPQPGDEPYVEEPVQPEPEPVAARQADVQVSRSGMEGRAAASGRRAGSQRGQTASVPSWYTAAREKAAKDYTPTEGAEGEESVAYRSRYADVHVRGSFTNMLNAGAAEHEQAPQREERTVEDEWLDVVKSAESRNAETPAQRAVNARRNPEPSTTRMQRVQQGAAQAQNAEPFTIDMKDEEIADISPDMTGAFVKSSANRPSNKGVHSPIPSIGSSNRQAASGDVAEDAGKGDRKRPTARRVSESFQPTRVADEREDMDAALSRQEAAVQSTYESTPQAGAAMPENDPFAPHSDAAVRAQQRAVPAGLSGTFQPVSSAQGAKLPAARPGATSSFPALTGSFPALSGTIPRLSEDAFTAPASGDADAFGAGSTAAASPSLTGGIEIPDSRFHNAVENVGGFLGKLGKKSKDEDASEDSFEGWAEDADDFGWKGGGYYSPEGGLGDAARRRAAEIRESVISMTENDLLDKEVWFVALGASNAGAQGMKNFMDLHAAELRGSLIINLEAVGSGEICYVDQEGAGRVNRSDRRLQTLVRKAAKEITGREMKAQHLDWRNTDVTPAMTGGLRAISIMGFDGVAPVGWHWRTDTSDIVDEERLDYVAKVLMKVIENS